VALKRINVIIPVVFDDRKTDPEAIAHLLDMLLEMSTLVPGCMSAYGEPKIEESTLCLEVVMEPQPIA
jgi:hypothetical protein